MKEGPEHEGESLDFDPKHDYMEEITGEATLPPEEKKIDKAPSLESEHQPPAPRRKKTNAKIADGTLPPEKELSPYEKVIGDDDTRDAYNALVASAFGKHRAHEKYSPEHQEVFNKRLRERWSSFEAFHADVSHLVEKQKESRASLLDPRMSEQMKSLVKAEIEHWPQKIKGIEEISRIFFNKEVDIGLMN
jgi:hypothetical protein